MGGLRLPPSIRFRPPRETTDSPSAANRIRDLPTEPRTGPAPETTPPPSTSAQRLGTFVESRRQAQAQQPVEAPAEQPSSSGQRLSEYLTGRSEAVAQQVREAQQTKQLQTAALTARLTDILSGGDVGADTEEGGRLERLDIRSELMLRRIAILLRKQAPKVSLSDGNVSGTS